MTDVITGIPNILLVGAVAFGAYSIYEWNDESEFDGDEEEE